jgi:iron-sulfur cluster assembly protein
MLSITDTAARQIRQASLDTGAEGMALRIAAHFDDASDEMHYGIGFDEEREHDEEIHSNGLTLLVSPLSRAAIEDLIIDYVEISPGDCRFIFYREGDIEDDDASSTDPCAGRCGGCGADGC